MPHDACAEPMCTWQHKQDLFDAEHRLREVLALALEQLIRCQDVLDLVAKARLCLLDLNVPCESPPESQNFTSLARYCVRHDTVDCTPRIGVPADALTPREAEVLRLIAVGMSNRAIAEALFLSPRTVERHIANIYVKIDVHSRADAMMFALRLGFA